MGLSATHFLNTITQAGSIKNSSSHYMLHVCTFPNWMGYTQLFSCLCAIHLPCNDSLNQMVPVTLMESYNVKIKHL